MRSPPEGIVCRARICTTLDQDGWHGVEFASSFGFLVGKGPTNDIVLICSLI
jgi:hypothetical protein